MKISELIVIAKEIRAEVRKNLYSPETVNTRLCDSKFGDNTDKLPNIIGAMKNLNQQDYALLQIIISCID